MDLLIETGDVRHQIGAGRHLGFAEGAQTGAETTGGTVTRAVDPVKEAFTLPYARETLESFLEKLHHLGCRTLLRPEDSRRAMFA